MIRIKTDLDIDLLVNKIKTNYKRLIKKEQKNESRIKSNRKRT